MRLYARAVGLAITLLFVLMITDSPPVLGQTDAVPPNPEPSGARVVVEMAEYRRVLDQVIAGLRAPGVTPADYGRILEPLSRIDAVTVRPIAPASADEPDTDTDVDAATDADTDADTDTEPAAQVTLLPPGLPAGDDAAGVAAPDGDESVSPAQLAARLELVRDRLATLERASPAETAAQLAQLQEVFARPVFSQQESLLDRVRRWIEERIRAWFPDWGSGETAVPAPVAAAVGWVVAGLAAIILIWLASYWLQGIFANLVGGGATAREVAGANIPASASAARQQAQQAADAGDYRQAVRRLYLAALLLLDEHDLVAFEPSQTNREVLARVPKPSPVAAHLRPVVETFDAVWYGLREPDAPTYARYAAEIEALDQIAAQSDTPSNRDANSAARGNKDGEKDGNKGDAP